METASLGAIAIAMFAATMASSGFWAWIMRQTDKQSGSNKLLLGLAHERIVTLGMGYVERGWVTKDEYDDLVRYLYKPYTKFGGNGLAEKIMQDVSKLPMYRKAPVQMRVEGYDDIKKLRAVNPGQTGWEPVTPESASRDFTDGVDG